MCVCAKGVINSEDDMHLGKRGEYRRRVSLVCHMLPGTRDSAEGVIRTLERACA